MGSSQGSTKKRWWWNLSLVGLLGSLASLPNTASAWEPVHFGRRPQIPLGEPASDPPSHEFVGISLSGGFEEMSNNFMKMKKKEGSIG